MSLRQIVYDQTKDKHRGFIDYGTISQNISQELTEVLVFQIVSYTRKFKCPITYVFINKFSGVIQNHNYLFMLL